MGISHAQAAEWRMRKINFDGGFMIKYDHDVMNLRHDNKVEIVHEAEVQEKKNCNVSINRLGPENLIGDHCEENVEKVQTENEAALIRRKCLEKISKK